MTSPVPRRDYSFAHSARPPPRLCKRGRAVLQDPHDRTRSDGLRVVAHCADLSASFPMRFRELAHMQLCPLCGTPLQTLDLPCAVCATQEEERDDLRHRFSKTFEIRTAYGYKPDTLVQNVNDFLWQQHTVDQLSANIHLDRQALVRGVTLHCVAGLVPVFAAFSVRQDPARRRLPPAEEPTRCRHRAQR